MSHASTRLDPSGRLSNEAAGRVVASLYESHGRAVYGLCRMLLRDPHDAEDASQSVFLSAHAAIARGGTPRDGGPWLSAIARNECRGRVRDRMREPVMTDVSAHDSLEAPELIPEDLLPDPSVQKALTALSDNQREAVVLHDVFGLRAREVGTALGLSLPAVEALLFRARRQLRMRLRPVAGALTTPVGIYEGLAALLPGFSGGGGPAVLAAGGATGGLIAKLAGAPLAAKVAAGVVAVGAGTATVTGVEQVSPREAKRPAASTNLSTAERTTPAVLVTTGTGREDDSSGPGDGSSGSDAERSARSRASSDDGSGQNGGGTNSDRDGSAGGAGTSGRGSEDDGGGQGPTGSSGEDGDSRGDDSGEGASSPSRSGAGSSGGSGSGKGKGDDEDGDGSGSNSGPGSGGARDDDDGGTESTPTDTRGDNDSGGTGEDTETGDFTKSEDDSAAGSDSSGTSGSGSSGSGSGSDDPDDD